MAIRYFFRKKAEADVASRALLKDLRDNLGILGLTDAQVFTGYDMEPGLADLGLSESDVFMEPSIEEPVDFMGLAKGQNTYAFILQYLPGQFDQRADSAMQLIKALAGRDALVVSLRGFVFFGELTESDTDKILNYCLNRVDTQVATLEPPKVLEMVFNAPDSVATIKGFTVMNTEDLNTLRKSYDLSMSGADIALCRDYFRDEEQRDPTITEIRILDTYWSDHCRHTTFLTEITDIQIEEGFYKPAIEKAFAEYLATREAVYGERSKTRPICLMDMATLGMKNMKKQGLLDDLDESDEINACSIVIDVDVDGVTEQWLLQFKNETHNHPTEIEPFGGAATCLGGAIRDPLSGRAYVYQAMRVTGSGDPRKAIGETLAGKLPQRKITKGAADGYSSYGNQMGIATGQVTEIYDESYVAKRMEVGAVIGAVKREHVRREKPTAGDVVLLIGGRTGRDGIGGASGSSKEHTTESIATCGAQVQKGNPPTERALMRLFRNPEATMMIKKCNDFGAGGVSVAIGELADGLDINLDAVPKKYQGLDGTELAISESQERMAVVVEAANAQKMIELAASENLEATLVATVTDDRRLTMKWRGEVVCSISRDFLDTNGARQQMTVSVKTDFQLPRQNPITSPHTKKHEIDIQQEWIGAVSGLNAASQKGLGEQFDSTVGAGTVFMPFGGKNQLTPPTAMAAKIPVLGETDTASLMSFGFDVEMSKASPFHGAIVSVVEAVTKLVAAGADYSTIRLSLQEYFPRLGSDPTRWGMPFAALLGALTVQNALGIPAIGGKDSMSGSFHELDVPPTLVAFAVSTGRASALVTPEFKGAGNKLVLLRAYSDEQRVPEFNQLIATYNIVKKAIESGAILSARHIGAGGLAAALTEMTLGNDIGFDIEFEAGRLILPMTGVILVECNGEMPAEFTAVEYEVLGCTLNTSEMRINGITLDREEVKRAWLSQLDSVFESGLIAQPAAQRTDFIIPETPAITMPTIKPNGRYTKPRVLIPVFPGTNCEYDTSRAFERAGGLAEHFVFRNLTTDALTESINSMASQIDNAQIIAFPGGFSAGDEPDGSAKYAAAICRHPRLAEAIEGLLERGGLAMGICNGFQILVKLGLLPFGKITKPSESNPTLTHNAIGRHISMVTQTKLVSKLSPWFSEDNLGDIHNVAISHGEGRFIISDELAQQLFTNGQVATVYAENGAPSMNYPYNPNGSFYAIEGITSPDGRILGKMGHTERAGANLLRNVPGDYDQKIFISGVKYFR